MPGVPPAASETGGASGPTARRLAKARSRAYPLRQMEFVPSQGCAHYRKGGNVAKVILLNPKHHTRPYPDERSREIMRKTIEFFERKGKRRLKEDDQERVWYADFLEFLQCEGIFATLFTPAAYGGPDARWDTWRICEFNEILGFYGLPYWYTWQVSILGLGPIWMSGNEDAKRKAAQLLEDGDIFAFGLSERAARRRHLLDRHDADPAGRRHLPGQRREVLHRQRQRGGHGLDLRQDRRHGRVRLLRRRLPAPELRAGRERRRQPELRRRVRPARLPGHRSRTSCRAATTPGTPRSTRSTSASTTSAGPRSASARTPSTRRSTTRPTGASTAWPSPTSRTCGRCSSTPTRGWSR